MKVKLQLSLVICFLILVCIISKTKFRKSHHKTVEPKKKHSLLSKILETEKNDKEIQFQGYFSIQKFYSGNDALDNIRLSETLPQTKFLQLSNKAVFFSKNQEMKENVEGFLLLKSLYDHKADDFLKGICCKSVVYSVINELKTSLTSKKFFIETKNFGLENANYCLDLKVLNKARWRICSSENTKISKLHSKIIYNVLLTQGKKEADFNLNEEKLGDERWSWENQHHWKKLCKGGNMQSPINIISGDTKEIEALSFSMSYHLEKVDAVIEKNHEEAIIHFTNFGGIFHFSLGYSYLAFTPSFMSFRFPGEHLLNGERSEGEILIHFREISPLNKSALSNGLILNIPVKSSSSALADENLDKLNIDFWKFKLQNANSYHSEYLNTNTSSFDLPGLMTKLKIGSRNNYLYFGSHTTPPCEEQTYHLVVDSPLVISESQLKVLRENSLLTNKNRSIHARIEQKLNNRTIYRIPSSSIKHFETNGAYSEEYKRFLTRTINFNKKEKPISISIE